MARRPTCVFFPWKESLLYIAYMCAARRASGGVIFVFLISTLSVVESLPRVKAHPPVLPFTKQIVGYFDLIKPDDSVCSRGFDHCMNIRWIEDHRGCGGVRRAERFHLGGRETSQTRQLFRFIPPALKCQWHPSRSRWGKFFVRTNERLGAGSARSIGE